MSLSLCLLSLPVPYCLGVKALVSSQAPACGAFGAFGALGALGAGGARDLKRLVSYCGLVFAKQADSNRILQHPRCQPKEQISSMR